MRYKAFISYSHHADALFAPALQSALHRFAKPFYRPRAIQVFRDKTELSANPALWPLIEKALRGAEYFILLASPGAARSPWVQREIQTWLELHEGSVDRLLIVWTEGELAWDAAAGDFDWRRTTALPSDLGGAAGTPSGRTLRGRFREEPFYLDLRWVRTATDLSLRNPRFLDDIATLAATLHGKPKSEMIGEDVQQHKRYRRVRTAVTALLAVLALLATGFGVLAERQRRIAEERTAVAVSRQLAAQSETLREEQPDLALLLSVEANRSADTIEARNSLLEGVGSSGRLLMSLRGHELDVTSVAFSPDGRLLVSASGDRTIRLWDARTGRPLGQLLAPNQGGVNALAFSPDGRILASAGQDHKVRFWDVHTRTLLGDPMIPHRGPGGGVDVQSVGFSPDGEVLLTSTPYDATRLWDAATRRPLGALDGGILGTRASRAAFSPDGRSFVTCGSTSSPLELWDTATRRLLGAFSGEAADEVISVGFSPDGKTLVAGERYGGLRLWDVQERRALDPPLLEPRPGGPRVFAAAFSPDGRTIAAAGDGGLVRLWDARTRQPLGNPLRGHLFEVYSLAFSPDGTVLATGGKDRTVRLWDLRTEQPLARRIAEGSPLDDEGVVILNAALSADGRLLATSIEEGGALLWDLASGRRAGPPLASEAMVSALGFNAAGGRLAAVDETGLATVWSTPDGRLIRQYALEIREPMHVLFSPDGNRLISVQPDGASRLWDLATGKPAGQAPAKLKMGAYLAASSRDGGTLALASVLGPVQLWDTRAGRLLAQLDQVPQRMSLALSEDARLLAAGNADGSIALWDAERRRPLGQIQASALIAGHVSGGVESNIATKLAFSPDGALLASASMQAVRLWDVRTRQLLGELLGRREEAESVANLAFSRDGRSLVVGGLVEEITVWDVDPGSWRRRACRIANRNLTPAEWEQYLGEQPYQKTCPELP